MASPPRLAITVGIAVATAVDSMAPRKRPSMTPKITAPRGGPGRGSAVSITSGARGGAGRAAAEPTEVTAAQRGFVAVLPADPETRALLVDFGRPDLALAQRCRRPLGTSRA